MISNYVAIDWGSTNLRAYNIVNGSIADSFESNQGVKNVSNKVEYPSILLNIINRFNLNNSSIPVIMSGMIGSTVGWVDAPYLRLPLKLEELSNSLISIDSKLLNPLFIQPGVAISDDVLSSFGVMRGEEIQVLGALKKENYDVVILPGTHSKWVKVSYDFGSQIDTFSTFMTGEMYATLLENTLVGDAIVKGDFDEEVFLSGVNRVKFNDIIESLFTTRSKILLNKLEANKGASYLSGMLISHEIKQNLEVLKSNKKIALIASNEIEDLYRLALDSFGVRTVDFLPPSEINLNGYNTIAHEVEV
jgi:2-dehydro-3-deoxygalactonokinase